MNMAEDWNVSWEHVKDENVQDIYRSNTSA